MKKIFEISWSDDLGQDWMNIFNLKLCLYTTKYTRKDLYQIKEISKEPNMKEETIMGFSITEKELYDFIEKKTEVTIQMIREQLSEKHVGALGKLIQGNKIEKYKKRGEKSFGYKMIAYYGIKVKKENTTPSKYDNCDNHNCQNKVKEGDNDVPTQKP